MKQSLYIELRKNNKLEEIAFEYYKEKGGKANFQTIINSGFLTFINFDSLLQELDTQYEITLTFYNNNLINVEPNARRKI